MADSNFVDYARIFASSGEGGAGSSHFRKEKFVEFGGPDGGDGGRGGHIILRGSTNHWTLLHLRYNKHHRAENGERGTGARMHGADGKDVYIDVPLGTVVKDGETGEQVCEVVESKQEVVLCRGGRGGKGNWHFRTSTNQAPRYSQTGGANQEGWYVLELKVLADVGLVGFPNAGKSTLLSVVSAAKPKIADYAFTTLEPNLGIVSGRGQQSLVMADIPGIIEGAAEGRGLGLRFLRHIERNSTLLFMVSCDSKDIAQQYEILLTELREHNPELLDKSRVLAVTKCDMLDEELTLALQEELSTSLPEGLPVIFISAVTGYHIDQLKDMLFAAIEA